MEIDVTDTIPNIRIIPAKKSGIFGVLIRLNILYSYISFLSHPIIFANKDYKKIDCMKKLLKNKKIISIFVKDMIKSIYRFHGKIDINTHST